MDNEITINGEVYVKKDSIKDPRKTQPVDEIIVEKPWHQEGDEYWYWDQEEGIRTGHYLNEMSFQKDLIKMGNFFRTQEEAQMYSLRIESLSKGFMPKEGKFFWTWDFFKQEPIEWSLSPRDFMIDPKFPTKEECQEWYDKFGKSWEYLLNK